MEGIENVMSSDDFDEVLDDKTSADSDVVEEDATPASYSDGVAADVDEPTIKVRRRGAAEITATSARLTCAFTLAFNSHAAEFPELLDHWASPFPKTYTHSNLVGDCLP